MPVSFDLAEAKKLPSWFSFRFCRVAFGTLMRYCELRLGLEEKYLTLFTVLCTIKCLCAILLCNMPYKYLKFYTFKHIVFL